MFGKDFEVGYPPQSRELDHACETKFPEPGYCIGRRRSALLPAYFKAVGEVRSRLGEVYSERRLFGSRGLKIWLKLEGW